MGLDSYKTIHFTVDLVVNIGNYDFALYLTSDFGYAEKLGVNLKVSAEKPDWTVDENDYQYSMSIIGQLKIDGTSTWTTYDKDGNIWLGSGRYGHILMIDATTKVISNHSDENFGDYIHGYKNLIADNLGNIYIANSLGLAKIDIATKDLACYSSQMTALDVSKNTLLEILYCYDNSLTELNIDNNIEITDLNFSDNAISTIDLSNNAKLEYLTAENTSLEALSIE